MLFKIKIKKGSKGRVRRRKGSQTKEAADTKISTKKQTSLPSCIIATSASQVLFHFPLNLASPLLGFLGVGCKLPI